MLRDCKMSRRQHETTHSTKKLSALRDLSTFLHTETTWILWILSRANQYTYPGIRKTISHTTANPDFHKANPLRKKRRHHTLALSTKRALSGATMFWTHRSTWLYDRPSEQTPSTRSICNWSKFTLQIHTLDYPILTNSQTTTVFPNMTLELRNSKMEHIL